MTELFVACLPGLEPLLEAELTELLEPGQEAVPLTALAGGVSLPHPGTAAVHDMLLRSGLASHLLQRVAAFRVLHLRELRRKAEAAADWRSLLPPGTPVVVQATCRKSRLYHSGAVEQRVQEALHAVCGVVPARSIEDGQAADTAPSEPPPAVPVLARIERDVCTLSIDLAGRPLHRRGYRLATGKAPLREDLAWALVRASGWSFDQPFVDPFAGSGTIAISAAQLAGRRAPGRELRFALERLGGHDAAGLATARQSLREAEIDVPVPIGTADRDAGAVQSTRENAERAGVGAALEVVHGNWRDAPGLAPDASGAPCTVVSNPPWGQRLKSKSDDRLVHLWQALGSVLRSLPPESRIVLLSSDRRLAERTGLRLRSAFLSNHGGTKVRGLRGAPPPPREPAPD